MNQRLYKYKQKPRDGQLADFQFPKQFYHVMDRLHDMTTTRSLGAPNRGLYIKAIRRRDHVHFGIVRAASSVGTLQVEGTALCFGAAA